MQKPKPEKLTPAEHPELVIGLVGAIGTDLECIRKVLKREFSKQQYTSVEIKPSSLLEEFFGKPASGKDNDNDRKHRLMDQGNDLRQITGQADVMAMLAIADVKRQRERCNSENGNLKRLFIISSLKHPKEVQLLRQVYGPAFYLISAYSDRETRLNTLTSQIADSVHDMNHRNYRFQAEALNNRDEEESDNPFGQDVRDTFPLADVFVDARTLADAEKNVRRFVDLLFGKPFCTPSTVEFGMFHAAAAARRSADLSRQVGAVITGKNHEILSLGCNDVPKPRGGLYWDGDEDDLRDWRIGHDSSHKIKRKIVREIVEKMREDWLSEEKRDQDTGSLVEELVGEQDSLLSGTRVMSLLEFGRICHAEMAALMEASRHGVSVAGGTLYCTTFPCHMCARHIIGAGIEHIVYIEPYPKSMVKELYKDAVTIEGTGQICCKSIAFDPFLGIAPRRYLEFFESEGRKDRDTGDALENERRDLRFVSIIEIHRFVELRVIRFVSSKLKQKRKQIADLKIEKYKDCMNCKTKISSLEKWLSCQPTDIKKLLSELTEDVRETIFPTCVIRQRSTSNSAKGNGRIGGQIR